MIDPAPTPAPVAPAETPKRKKTKLTIAVVGCSFGLLLAFFFGPMLVVPFVLDRLNFAQRKKAELDIESLVRVLDKYAAHNGGVYPESLELLLAPDPTGEVLLKLQSLPRDPWGNAYVYFRPVEGAPPRLVSYGKDGKPGGEGSGADIDSASFAND
jgi:general secretion pathway protein G